MAGQKVEKIYTPDGIFSGWQFECPVCESVHVFDKRREFNGIPEAPTFTPSLKVTWPDGNICHSFVTDGKIKYCADSSHHLAGQTVELKERT